MNPEVRVARKEHLCDFCERVIPQGTQYSYERLTPWDHPDNEGYGTWRAHLRCREFFSANSHKFNGEYPNDAGLFREMLATGEAD